MMQKFKQSVTTCKWITLLAATSILAGCSTNAATGERQFTGLMSPQKENQIGASQHEQALKAYGGLYEDQKLQNYVTEIGNRLAKYSERKDVQYRFFLLNSPVVNAFAVPGGYIYVTRGLLAYTNSEAELAGVMAHEMGHITGRHSAERYSTGVLTQIGATIASAAIGSDAASQALGLGSNLFLSSYSRGQESEADRLGVRYLSYAGYDDHALSEFLESLNMESQLQARINKQQAAPSFFATHPNTEKRVVEAEAEAQKFPANDEVTNRDRHLSMLDGMVFGDSADQGFVKGTTFYHPELGFTFKAPTGWHIANETSQVIAKSDSGTSALILDAANNKAGLSPARYITDVWMKSAANAAVPETTSVNGMNAATTTFGGTLNGQAVTIRVFAISFDANTIYRFQAAYPKGDTATEAALRNAIFSFRHLKAGEADNIQPYRLKIFTAGASDTVASVASRLPYPDYKEERFRALNRLPGNAGLQVGRRYKTVVE
ncbi:MAG: M48 family metalloprotease [Pseudobdellovibrionaceae bacterium]